MLGLTGLLWAQPVADSLSLLIAAALYLRTYKKLTSAEELQRTACAVTGL